MVISCLCSIWCLSRLAQKLRHTIISEITQWYVIFCREHYQWMSSIFIFYLLKNTSRKIEEKICGENLVSFSFKKISNVLVAVKLLHIIGSIIGRILGPPYSGRLGTMIYVYPEPSIQRVWPTRFELDTIWRLLLCWASTKQKNIRHVVTQWNQVDQTLYRWL